MESIRFIVNPFLHNWNTIEASEEQACRIFMTRLIDFTNNVSVPSGVAIASDQKENHRGFDMFEGAGGYLYLYIKLYKFFNSAKPELVETLRKVSGIKDETFYKLSDPKYYLQSGTAQFNLLLDTINKSKPKRDQITFSFSKYAVFLQGVHLSFLLKDPKQFKNNIKRFLEGHQYIMKNKPQICEILYGVPGYLIMLLELHNEYKVIGLENENYEINVVKEVSQLVDMILAKGIYLYEKTYKTKVDLNYDLPVNFRLVYHFYDKQYLGGAHGLGGVLNVLLLSYQLFSTSGFNKDLNRIIKATVIKSVEFLLTQRVNNNFGSSVKKQLTYSKLIQFCHGNPGILTPLLHFCELFPESAKKFKLHEIIVNHMNKIWQEGVLKKGFWGLCHGTSGNAYTFISPIFHRVLPMYNEQFRKKALLFWSLQQNDAITHEIKNFDFNDRITQGISDFPYSLMLGSAGDLCFGTDLLYGQGTFPGYDL